MESWVLYTFGSLLFFGAVGYWHFVLKQFKNYVQIHDLVNRNAVVRTVKAREIIDKDGIARWLLQKENVKLDPPAAEFISLTASGKKFAIAFKYGDLDYRWAKIDAEKYTNENRDAVAKISNGGRIALFNQYLKSIQERQTSMETLIQQALPIIAIGIVCIAAFFMYNNIGENMNKVVAGYDGIMQRQAEITKTQEETMLIIRDVLQEKTTFYPFLNRTVPN